MQINNNINLNNTVSESKPQVNSKDIPANDEQKNNINNTEDTFSSSQTTDADESMYSPVMPFLFPFFRG